MSEANQASPVSEANQASPVSEANQASLSADFRWKACWSSRWSRRWRPRSPPASSADLGARVIKIERPGAGDFARGYDQTVRGQSSYFVWLNRGKESVELDVKQPADRAVLDAMLARADVFVQNLAPGAAERLGLGARAARRPLSAADQLLDLGIRPGRPVRRQEGLRPAGAVRGRAAVRHRDAGRAGQGRDLGRRHRGRDVRLLRRADRAVRAGADRPGRLLRGGHARRAGRMDEPALLLQRLRRPDLAAHRGAARLDLPVRALPGPRMARCSWASRTSASGRCCASGSWAARTWSPMSGSRPTRPGSRTTTS